MSRRIKGHEGGEGREFFPTPLWVPKLLLEVLRLPDGPWLEPSAGEGHLIRGVNLARTGRQDDSGAIVWTAIEVHPPCEDHLRALAARVHIGDARRVLVDLRDEQRSYSVAIANPPFSLAASIAISLMGLAEWVVVLQRSTWIGDDEVRLKYFREHLPDEYRLGRVSFDGEGSDATTYSWFVWPPRARGRARASYQLLRRPTTSERAQRPRPLVGAPKRPEQLDILGRDYHAE